MKLEDLIRDIGPLVSRGPLNIPIKGLASDSREVGEGYLFAALKGHEKDGHDFVEAAIRQGAAAVVGESPLPLIPAGKGVALIQVADSREALAEMAVKFYDSPFLGMELVAITGTNGKTTTSYIIESIIKEAGAIPGVIGTVNYRMPGKTVPAPVTTPGTLELMRTLRQMKDRGVTHVVMEVSSHALTQGRVKRCPFRVALFTNLSRDHLDYHDSMDAYFEAKSLLFRGLRDQENREMSWAVINRDDPRSEDLARLAGVPVITYGFSEGSLIRASGVEMSRHGLRAVLTTPEGELEVKSTLIGRFNVYNIMAAFASSRCLGIDDETIISGIGRLNGVPGRLEMVENNRSISILVDYAHTPDALLKAIEAVEPVRQGRLITVFGCGGDRDSGKRKEMGRVAGTLSDLCVITSDNPRTEDPLKIARQVEEGVLRAGALAAEFPLSKKAPGRGYIIELDRRKAIEKAIKGALEGDIILIAGKGHEDYQIIGRERRHFDDREVARALAS